MSQALIPLAPTEVERPASHADTRANADFIAHLIATSQKLPQTRERRRTDPDLAVAAYGALGQWPTPLGRALSRSL